MRAALLDVKGVKRAKVTMEPSEALVTYDPAKTYDAYKAFLAGDGKNVDVIENVDIGAGYAARAIKAAGRAGKAFSVGWNVTPSMRCSGNCTGYRRTVLTRLRCR